MAKDKPMPGVEVLAEALWQNDRPTRPGVLKLGTRWDSLPAYAKDEYRRAAEWMATNIGAIKPGYSVVSTAEHKALEGVAAAAAQAWDESDVGSVPYYVGNALGVLDEVRRRARG